MSLPLNHKEICEQIRKDAEKTYSPLFHLSYSWKYRPTWSNAYSWSNYRLSDGPMTEAEYESYKDSMARHTADGTAEADKMNRLRCRTTVGWYIADWAKWVRCLTVSGYRVGKNDYANEIAWDYWDDYLNSMDDTWDFYDDEEDDMIWGS